MGRACFWAEPPNQYCVASVNTLVRDVDSLCCKVCEVGPGSFKERNPLARPSWMPEWSISYPHSRPNGRWSAYPSLVSALKEVERDEGEERAWYDRLGLEGHKLTMKQWAILSPSIFSTGKVLLVYPAAGEVVRGESSVAGWPSLDSRWGDFDTLSYFGGGWLTLERLLAVGARRMYISRRADSDLARDLARWWRACGCRFHSGLRKGERFILAWDFMSSWVGLRSLDGGGESLASKVARAALGISSHEFTHGEETSPTEWSVADVICHSRLFWSGRVTDPNDRLRAACGALMLDRGHPIGEMPDDAECVSWLAALVNRGLSLGSKTTTNLIMSPTEDPILAYPHGHCSPLTPWVPHASTASIVEWGEVSDTPLQDIEGILRYSRAGWEMKSLIFLKRGGAGWLHKYSGESTDGSGAPSPFRAGEVTGLRIGLRICPCVVATIFLLFLTIGEGAGAVFFFSVLITLWVGFALRILCAIKCEWHDGEDPTYSGTFAVLCRKDREYWELALMGLEGSTISHEYLRVCGARTVDMRTEWSRSISTAPRPTSISPTPWVILRSRLLLFDGGGNEELDRGPQSDRTAQEAGRGHSANGIPVGVVCWGPGGRGNVGTWAYDPKGVSPPSGKGHYLRRWRRTVAHFWNES